MQAEAERCTHMHAVRGGWAEVVERVNARCTVDSLRTAVAVVSMARGNYCNP